ncbi:hypothetical protein TAGGR_1690 [Thermodesulfovibrio aggregans]|uniref:Uncharacterized protein n=1 Tax=Thermodesulfovibrio aggregans TaxID=86166 RepID=A0A0U9HRY4_9BACT|nr:hypothetical protein TAGGR_1690 [Thermodesulfovibrio aggregans]
MKNHGNVNLIVSTVTLEAFLSIKSLILFYECSFKYFSLSLSIISCIIDLKYNDIINYTLSKILLFCLSLFVSSSLHRHWKVWHGYRFCVDRGLFALCYLLYTLCLTLTVKNLKFFIFNMLGRPVLFTPLQLL